MIPLLMFATLFVLVFIGVPVAFSLMIIAIAFGYTVFGDLIFLQLYGPLLSTASNFVLAAIPLFIFMGAVLERSGIAKRLFYALQLWLGGLPGGLALSTIAMCAIFAAASGVVGAVEIVVGMMAIPPMMKAGYKNDLIAGTICAGGSLGTIIPPSVIVVVYASIAQLSTGQLFAASILPGLLMVVFFVGYILVRSIMHPNDAPPLPLAERTTPVAEKIKISMTAMLPPLALIVMVLGSLLAGIASATEAAAVGAAGTVLLTLMFRELNLKLIMDSLGVTLRITSMIMLIIAGGTMFTSIFAVTGGGNLVRDTVETIGYGNVGIIAFFLTVVFFAGFVLDWVSIVLIFIPIFAPIVKSAGIDPIWFAMMVLVVIQTSYLTPPMAPSIFYLRSIAPKSMTYGQMYRGVLPFVGAQMLVLVVIILFPAVVTWLPSVLVGL
ncbi:TRAP transporter large permease [Pacificibacter marinus]|uniref:TRAP transporter large permease protein n=1 Tax=Pacificibacter marinus TaxID=658057 RepID=A0A1Y5RY29_9RHOB|nr:TRAP transporter large permease subunit [Pacificibacter marinus]SEK40345.1 TRAP transporter, DctM subunit [Pacificibacter marinus]SLN25296.1 Sialic acid TRAP transporter permease protein SiaT [Pacificibacter marinus]